MADQKKVASMEKERDPRHRLGVFLPGKLLARWAVGVHQYLC